MDKATIEAMIERLELRKKDFLPLGNTKSGNGYIPGFMDGIDEAIKTLKIELKVAGV